MHYILCFMVAIGFPGFSGEDPAKVKIVNITASSSLKDVDNDYNPDNVRDGTWIPWVEGKSDDGFDEFVEMEFAEKVTVKEFYLKNGIGIKKFQDANNRVKKLSVSSESGDSCDAECEDVMEYRKISLADSVTGKKIRFKIKEVYQGTKYHDTCISEIAFNQPVEDVPFLVSNSATNESGIRYGFVSRMNGAVIPLKYHYATPFSGGTAAVGDGKRAWLINTKGERIGKYEFNMIDEFHDGLAYAEKDSRKMFVNTKGDIVFEISGKYEWGPDGSPYFNDNALVLNKQPSFDNDDGFYRVYDTSGTSRIIGKNGYRKNSWFSDWLMLVAKVTGDSTRYAYWDKSGAEVLRVPYSNIGCFSNGLAPFMNGNKWGYIDKKVKVVIKPEF
ncbi:MAG TPA: WG repeat-containing protein, partial [Spirochaetota bacterium]|nr:WG repeat-containing protein [Spirochaetota bacterium]